MDNKKGILELTLSKRTDLIKLILAAFILAVGSGLIANYLTDYFKTSPIVFLIIGGVFIVSVIIFFVYSIINEANKEIVIDGIVPINNKSNKVIPIFRYEFSEKLEDTMEAVFLENEALKQYWEDDFKKKAEKDNEDNSRNKNTEPVKKNGIGYFSIVRVEEKEDKKVKSKSNKILEEIVEYLIIEQLSRHLSTYFNNYSGQDEMIKKHTRNDFPEILLQNRIVNLLSTPFEDRAIFVKAGMTSNPPKGEIVAIYGNDGSRFSKFDLYLPKGSIIKRPQDGILTVENNRIFIQIEIHYGNFSSTLPKGFEQNYLGLEHRDLSVKKIDIRLNYKLKPIAFFYRSKWNYHNWVDSFEERLIEFFSFENFISTINWETNLTNIIINNQTRRILKEKED